ncbi:protein meaA [Pelagibacteraceae bacterium]|jgi:(2R)-ethylmalonyl-CoA mutase|nr:protein meaA [Pelagibacteraceae bacterium]|tara:strand:+ start:261 stop:2216 length:1956 start_codon:yes stop_codon:yes gene_type:complete
MDKPWLIRTYAGHSTAKKSNELYLKNLAKGQTGLSIAFDLPTQTGYDSDHILASGEVGKVGVPISHIGDMRILFNKIPLDQMNTSMTINATAAWLLSLYIALADEQGIDRSKLQGTTQNDIIKEYLSRGTHVFPPAPSLRLISDMITYTYKELPKWNPVNICSYHLQEVGAKPVQELAFALSTAVAYLDRVKESDVLSSEEFENVVGRISFFVNSGIKFITEMCKMRAFVDLWDEITKERYGVKNPKNRRFRYGVQVNSLGLTEQQPENNVYRILIEMMAVVLSKDARARAVQLPAWNEALGLPRPWDQQWSLRLQQILAYETDLLEFEDLFNGSKVIDEKVSEMKTEAKKEFDYIQSIGGAVIGIENSYLKQQLVNSNKERIQNINDGKQVVVGVNKYTETESSPLTANDSGIETIDSSVEAEQIKALNEWRNARDNSAVKEALNKLKEAAESDQNIMEASIHAAKVGVTTGEWTNTLRDIYGEFRAPTGISQNIKTVSNGDYSAIIKRVDNISKKIGRRIKFLVGKPGLDGHSSGAEQIAVSASDCGMDVLYEGIRLTPEQIVKSSVEEDVHIIGLSILSGSHIQLVAEIMSELKKNNIDNIPVIVGGIIPVEDEKILLQNGVKAVYTPKNYQMSDIMSDIVSIVEKEI